MIFYPDIITLPEKHPGLKVKKSVVVTCSGGKNLYMDLEFHLDDEMRKACKWIYTRFKTKCNIDMSFRTITVASFMMTTPNGIYNDAFLVNISEHDDPFIRVNVKFADNFVCTECDICRTLKEVDDAVCKVEGRLKEILQKYKKHLIKEAANVYTV